MRLEDGPICSNRHGAPLLALICLGSIVSLESNVSAEEARRSPIKLEEISIVDFIQRPSLFFQVNGKSTIAPIQPSPVCAQGAQGNTKRCRGREDARAAYDIAVKSWSKVNGQRHRLEAVGKALTVKRRRPNGQSRRPPILDEIVSTDSRAFDDLSHLAVLSIGETSSDLDQVYETLLQARGAFERCSKVTRKGSGKARHRLAFMIELGSKGQLVATHNAASGPRSKESTCLEPVLKALRFPQHASRGVDRFAVFFRPGTTVVEPVSDSDGAWEESANVGSETSVPSTEGGGGTALSGPFTISTVRQILVRSMDGFRTCFIGAHRGSPSVPGRVTVSFVVKRGGRVSAASIDEGTLSDAAGDCLLEKLRRLRLPSPEGGDVPLTHTFVFHR